MENKLSSRYVMLLNHLSKAYNFWREEREKVRSCIWNNVKAIPNLRSLTNLSTIESGTGGMLTIHIPRVEHRTCPDTLDHTAWMLFLWLYIPSCSPNRSYKLPAKTLTWEEIAIL